VTTVHVSQVLRLVSERHEQYAAREQQCAHEVILISARSRRDLGF